MLEPCDPSLPCACGLKKDLENLVAVLYFGLVFCLWLFRGLFRFLPQEVLSVRSAEQAQEWLHVNPFRQVRWEPFPCLCRCERKSHTVPVDFQGLCFSPVP